MSFPLLALISWLGAAAHGADVEPKSVIVQRYYDQAFGYYKAGDYGRAIQIWDDILRLDPEQRTAKEMIREVQKNIEQANSRRMAAVLAHIRLGHYRSALSGLETLLEEGNRTPFASNLQSQLEEIVQIKPTVSDKTKPWRLAVMSLNAALGKTQEIKLAYNGLRYARELAPEDAHIKRLLDWFLNRHPEFTNSDVVTPGMTLLEYKRSLALDHLYGARYHQAIETLNDILALEPEDVVALKRLGSAYYSLGLPEKARQSWQEALVLAPSDPQLKKFLRKLAPEGAPAAKKRRR
ncbi:MAG: tetratricopeptide repeat protein [Elusimicrobia bacterium]|nr:tetratricopeptide repeat protein [Elusimicrobiota bacterium]